MLNAGLLVAMRAPGRPRWSAQKQASTRGDALHAKNRHVPRVKPVVPMTAGGICSSMPRRSICSSSPSSPRAAWSWFRATHETGFSAEPGVLRGPGPNSVPIRASGSGVTKQPWRAGAQRQLDAWSRRALRPSMGSTSMAPTGDGSSVCTSPSRREPRLRRAPRPLLPRSPGEQGVDSALP